MATNRQNVIQAIKSYGRQLFGFIRSRVSNKEDAEDILQEVWYQLSNLPETTSIESISGWLYRVARNKITDNYRKRKDVVSMEYDESQDEEDLMFMAGAYSGENNSPESEQFRDIFWEELMKALEELPESQRQVFIWNELEELTFREISEQTGENIKTLISRKRYAVMHLRERLEYLYQDIMNF